MKKIIINFGLMIFILTSCQKIEVKDPVNDIPNFVGDWSRIYALGDNPSDEKYTASYLIDTNTIKYSNLSNENATSIANTEYTIHFDSYDEIDGRWIGHNDNNKYYLIFFKNITADEITIYKKTVANPNNAQEIEIPSDDDDTNYGWNTYQKN